MSNAIWCDFGGHAFSELEPGWRSITFTGNSTHYPQSVKASVTTTACAKHIPPIPSMIGEITTGSVEKDDWKDDGAAMLQVPKGRSPIRPYAIVHILP